MSSVIERAVTSAFGGAGASPLEQGRIALAAASLDGIDGLTPNIIATAIAAGVLTARWETVPGFKDGTTTTAVDLRHRGETLAVVTVDHAGRVRGFCGRPGDRP